MTVAMLLTPLEIVLNDALKIQAMKRPVKPGNRSNVCITNKGYNCVKKRHLIFKALCIDHPT
jgi:hypothetical protein